MHEDNSHYWSDLDRGADKLGRSALSGVETGLGIAAYIFAALVGLGGAALLITLWAM